MSRRRDPAADVVSFFELADEHTVQLLFRIVRGIVARRGLLREKPGAAITPPRRRRVKPNGGDTAVPQAQE